MTALTDRQLLTLRALLAGRAVTPDQAGLVEAWLTVGDYEMAWCPPGRCVNPLGLLGAWVTTRSWREIGEEQEQKLFLSAQTGVILVTKLRR